MIHGVHHDVNFEFAEIDLAWVEGKQNINIFKGFCFVAQLPSPVSHLTVAVTNADGGKEWFRGLVKSVAGLKQVSFQDLEFEDLFDVYSTGEREARRLLDRRALRAAINLRRVRHADSVEFGFNNDWFVLKLATEHNLFKTVSAHSSALATEDIRLFLEEVQEVLQIAETIGVVTAS